MTLSPASWGRLLHQLEQSVDAAGWDQAPMLFAAFPHADADSGALGVRVELIGMLDGNPRAALRGRSAPGALAVILVTEGWTAEAALAGDMEVLPREHPERQELRQATLITASGEHLLLVRLRGEAAGLQDAAYLAGPIPDLLRRVLGVDPRPTTHTVGELLGLLALSIAIRPLGDGFLGDSPWGMSRCVGVVHSQVSAAVGLTATGPVELATELSWTRIAEGPAFLGVEWLDTDIAVWFGPDALANLLCERLWGPYAEAVDTLRALIGEDAAEASIEVLTGAGWAPSPSI